MPGALAQRFIAGLRPMKVKSPEGTAERGVLSSLRDCGGCQTEIPAMNRWAILVVLSDANQILSRVKRRVLMRANGEGAFLCKETEIDP